jgi:hypothetical protein
MGVAISPGATAERIGAQRWPMVVDNDPSPEIASSASARCLPLKNAASTTALRANRSAKTTIPRMGVYQL